MDKFHYYVTEANKAFRVADHLAYVTYPVVHDSKLMATILDQLHLALQHGMAALLYYDTLYKRLSTFPREFEAQFPLFQGVTCKRYNIGQDTCVLIQEVDDLVRHRRESPVEFSRRDKYVIASNTYRLRTLSIEKIKHYVMQTKKFIEKVNEIHAANIRRTG